MRRYMYVAEGVTPIIAHAEDKNGMRAYVRDWLGYPAWVPLPSHCVCRVA